MLSGDSWLNAARPLTWQSLRGQPVLLVLFDLNQASFVPLVPPLREFQEAYGEQGLVVVGVHAHGARDVPPAEIEKLLEARK